MATWRTTRNAVRALNRISVGIALRHTITEGDNGGHQPVRTLHLRAYPKRVCAKVVALSTSGRPFCSSFKSFGSIFRGCKAFQMLEGLSKAIRLFKGCKAFRSIFKGSMFSVLIKSCFGAPLYHAVSIRLPAQIN